VTVVETRVSVWEALAGRAPGTPVAPADPGLWAAVAERLNPARAKPVLRTGVEAAQLVSVRNVEYVMLRSPDRTLACYLRLTPDELALARLMDGTRTVARLVAEFARITGRLAPDQVTRVVADLAANRMLEELPVDAFRPLAKVKRWPARLGRGLLAGIRGQRLVIARIDPFVGLLYKAGGRLLFTRVAAVLLGLVALAGLAVFGWTWALGSQPVFLTGRSYALGAAVLLGFNVLALACHELGHALATKHAGRRVPAAGFLVYFGIPSVFVDTTDVWMAGRRARLLTTAAGPATGLVLAGAAQLASLAYPPLAPWTFKLSFAWYLNVAFNLNPFLALDGYYLLMDWLEVPNLRARAMAWLVARARRRPQRFGDLDREGRLVALYGMLSLIWLVIAANLAYRVYVDRVGGLVTGLWRAGWPQRVLLLAVVAGLAAPLLYVAAGWLGKRWRRLRDRLAERSVAADAPRRFDALRGSRLGGLPAAALNALARDARWVRPKTGEQLVFAGAAQHSVYVVVDGALEGRRPGDPGGWVRERVGAGGVVGLAPALTGAPSALAWHTAGTTLLAIPPSSVAVAVGPVPGPPPAERAELEALFDHAPALAGLSTEDRLGLMAAARPVSLPPGALLNLSGAQDAAVVASGVLVRGDGMELRAGTLVGPFGVPPAGPVGAARTPVRAWVLPAFGGLPVLLRSSTPPVPGIGPAFGVHPPGGYPPLAGPPGVPPSTVDETKDGKFERKLWWLLILLLLFALLLTGSNLLPGPAWGEMPDDRALLHVDKGTTTVTVGGIQRTLGAGDDYYAGRTDTVSVGDRSLARLTFRGGGYTVLCGGSRVALGELSSVGRPIEPSGALDLLDGKLLADTAGTSRAFSALNLRVASGGGRLANAGAARFAVAGRDVTVAAGTVSMDGSAVAPVGGALSCGNGQIGVIPVPGTSNSPSPAGPTDSASPSPSPSASASASRSASAGASASPSKSPTQGPTGGPPPTTGPPPPPPNNPPVITWANGGDPGGGTIDHMWNGGACNQGRLTILYEVFVKDDHDGMPALDVELNWKGKYFSGSKRMGIRADRFYASLGPFDYKVTGGQSDFFTMSITAKDSGGKVTTLPAKGVALLNCTIIS
jgi:putative peptide zinc metalloprotease protein